jgi:hypothetical protein
MSTGYIRKRTAVDVHGNRIELTESQDSEFTMRHDGSIGYHALPKFFCPDGRRVIPEGQGAYRTMWGIRYELID